MNIYNQSEIIIIQIGLIFLDHPYRMSIIDGSGSDKTTALLTLIKNQRDIGKIYLYVKDPFESKYQLLINGIEIVGIKKSKNPKAFIDYSQRIDDVFENLQDYIIHQRKGEC